MLTYKCCGHIGYAMICEQNTFG